MDWGWDAIGEYVGVEIRLAVSDDVGEESAKVGGGRMMASYCRLRSSLLSSLYVCVCVLV